MNGWATAGASSSRTRRTSPRCAPTELGALAQLEPEFARRNAKLIGLSVDPVEDHARWLPDIKDVTGFLPGYPLIGDHDLEGRKALRHASR